MPVTLSEFRKRLIDSGLMTEIDVEEVLTAFQSTNENATEETEFSGESLAKHLIRSNRLTAWQAKQVYQGKIKSLVLGNYVLQDKLGQGGMGTVYKAEHQVMKRVVALKTLSAEITKSKTLLSRFRREVQVAARLEHPNIVTAYDADHAGKVHYLVMQFVDGEDLSVLVRRDGRLTIEKAIDCIKQAAQGLQYAHDQKVIHRDIKPSNLLLDRTGTLKILDMGLARIESANEAVSELTATGTIMGTVDYMAPEQAEDTRQADARSDIYSLGCSMFYLLTARATFGGETVVQRILAHRESAIPSLGAYIPNATPALDDLFRKMVAKTPDERFQSMKELIVELDKFSSGHSTLTVKSAVSEDSKFDEFLDAMDSNGNSPSDSIAPTINTKVPDRSLGEDDQAPPGHAPTFPLKAVIEETPRPIKPNTTNSKVKQKQKWFLGGGVALVLLLIIAAFFPNGDQPVPDDDPVKPAESFDEIQSVEITQNTPVTNSGQDSSLTFDGIDDYVEIPEFQMNDASPVTVEAWLTCLDATRNSNPIMIMGDEWLAMYHSDGGWGVGKLHGDEAMLKRVLDSVVVGERVHIAGVWDGSEMHVFINGELPEAVPQGYPLAPTSRGLLLGGGTPEHFLSNDSNRFFNGMIHQVRVSDFPRYSAPFTPDVVMKSDKGTTGLYLLNEGTGDEVQDSSGNQRNGTIHGATWGAP